MPAWTLAASSPTVRAVGSRAVRQAMAVVVVAHLAGELLDGAPLVVVVRLVGEAVAAEEPVAVHQAGEVAEALVGEHLAGVEMADAQPMAEETVHEPLMVVVMAPEQHTAAQLPMAVRHRMAEERRMVATTATVHHMVVSAREDEHPHGVDHLATPPRSRVVCLLLRLGHTTPLLQVRMPLPRLVDTVHILHLHQVVHQWTLLRRATTLRRHQEIALVADTVLLPHQHRVVGTLQHQHQVVIQDMIRVVNL